MPVPSSAEIMGMVDASDLPPNHQAPFARALAEPIAEALRNFAATSLIGPGVATSAIPPAQAGVTTAPGNLIPVILPAAHHKVAVARSTRGLRLDRAQQETLDSMVAEGLAKGFEALSGALMLPGVPVAGGITTGPGRLQAPLVGTLAATLPSHLARLDPRAWIPPAPVRGQRGVLGPCLPKKPSKTIGALIAGSMRLFVDRVMVAPGIPAPGPVTAGPGRLL